MNEHFASHRLLIRLVFGSLYQMHRQPSFEKPA
jgi:hypothetical protein